MISFPLYNDNLIPWLIQVSAIAMFGTALPLLFRVRHPKSQLAYCHAVLVVCIFLPLGEPWHHPFQIASGSTVPAMTGSAGLGWLAIMGWVLAAGIVAKLCWLACGLLQIRRFRATAVPMRTNMESVRDARRLTRADARFGISRSVEGPATLGHLDPIVLLPESFLILDYDAQLSILCHELLHVRRKDWLVTLMEETVASVFWFNPAIWWLLSQTKLSREQLVDHEVVSLTAAPTPYVHALLTMAGAAKGSHAIPAALFLTEGHLARRVRSLLTKHRGSPLRLMFSYLSMGCLLTVITWTTVVCFPLIGKAQTVKSAAQRNTIPPQLISLVPQQDSASQRASTFTVRVSAPEKSESVSYGVIGGAAESAPSGTGQVLLVPPPSPPPPPPPSATRDEPFGFLAVKGVRLLRPGEKATPEDIAQMRAALGEQAVLEVIQTEDGSVQRISVQRRRSPNEISVLPYNVIFGTIGPGPAVPTGSADGVH